MNGGASVALRFIHSCLCHFSSFDWEEFLFLERISDSPNVLADHCVHPNNVSTVSLGCPSICLIFARKFLSGKDTDKGMDWKMYGSAF